MYPLKEVLLLVTCGTCDDFDDIVAWGKHHLDFLRRFSAYHLAEAKQLAGALVTIDAIGCQVEIADKIVAHQADYLLALKGNQPTLEADVVDYFRTAPATELVTKTTVEKNHGRIETRTYAASKTVDWIVSERSYPGQPRFATIKAIVKVSTRPEPSMPTDQPSIPEPISLPHRSTSSVSPRRSVAIGASKACIGYSMSSSKTICRDTEQVTALKTWRSSAASPSSIDSMEIVF